MILFTISFLFIFLSAFFISSIVEKYSKTKTKPIFVYMCLTAFAQIILDFEILSLFSAINGVGFLCLNFLFLIISVSIVKFKHIELSIFDFKAFCNDIAKALKRDKLLVLCMFSLLFFAFIALVLVIIAPVSISDAMAYHVPRAVNWIINGSISHFPTNDMRINTMPVNSELLFAWVIMYLKSDIALGFISFFGYLNTIVVLYCFLGELGFCLRKRIWTVFVFSGLAFVVIETSSSDTNIFTGTFVLSSLYLFYCAIKYNKNVLLFMSALSLAIGCGVKTTVLIACPAVAIMMLCIAVLFRRKDFYNPILKFTAFFILNFLIFSSYNYILNYMDYNGFASTAAQYEYHRFRGGIRSYLSSLIKYSFMLFDFSGIPFVARFELLLKYFIDAFHLLITGVSFDTYNSAWYLETELPINYYLFETKVGMGLTGILVFFPSLLISLFKYRKPRHIISLFGYMYIINILLFAGLVLYTGYNSRYLTTFAVISSPVLVCSYIKSYKHIYKWLIILVACYYLLIASQRNPYKMISEILTDLKKTHSVMSVRHKLRGSSVSFSGDELSVIRLRNYIVDKKFKNIAFFSNQGDLLLPFDILRLYGHNISYLSFENLDGVNLSDYDMIIVHTMFQQTDNIMKYKNNDTSFEIDHGVKVYYDDKNDVRCYYVNYANKVIDKNSDGIPVFANCPIPIERFDDLGYRVSDVFPEDKYSSSEAVVKNPNNKDYAVYIKKSGL